MFTAMCTRCARRATFVPTLLPTLLPRLLLLVFLAAAGLSGCGGGGGDPGNSGTPPPAPAPVPLTLGLTEVASGLESPVFLTSPVGDSRQFIVERGGRIRILQDGRLLVQPFLDIGRFISIAGEGGLLSLAFHPRYADNGWFFVYYTDVSGNIVVERFSVSLNRNVANPDSGLAIIVIGHPDFTNHYGGLASFGPDGFLYLGIGDGGGAGDPQRNAQDPQDLRGKLLRIDVDASTLARRYAIPSSNPFAGLAGRRGEIWASGLRNPWRYAFDANLLYIADVGQERREEVNVVTSAEGGQNYGWSFMEGSLCFNPVTCLSAGLTLPDFEYNHGVDQVDGCSITGGYVYRGKAIPELAGRYFYSDFCAGFLKSFVADGSRITEETDWKIRTIGSVPSFGRDADGELYLMNLEGRVFKIVRTSAAPG